MCYELVWVILIVCTRHFLLASTLGAVEREREQSKLCERVGWTSSRLTFVHVLKQQKRALWYGMLSLKDGSDINNDVSTTSLPDKRWATSFDTQIEPLISWKTMEERWDRRCTFNCERLFARLQLFFLWRNEFVKLGRETFDTDQHRWSVLNSMEEIGGYSFSQTSSTAVTIHRGCFLTFLLPRLRGDYLEHFPWITCFRLRVSIAPHLECHWTFDSGFSDMAEDNIQLPNYLCFKPSRTKVGQNGSAEKHSLDSTR